MAILWCGGEDVDFPAQAAPYVHNYYRTGYARCSVSPWTASPNHCRSLPFVGGAVTSCWLSAWVYPYNCADAHFLGLGKASVGTSKGLYIGGQGQAGYNGKVRLIKYDDASDSVLATEVGTSLQNITFAKLDMQITNFGAGANVKVFVNGGASAVIDYTGDVTVSGLSDLNSVILGGFTATNFFYAFSEIIVADEDTRAMSLVTLAPNAAGDASAWAGAYTDVDEVAAADADVVFSNVNDDQMQVNLSNTPAGTFSVKAVQISARCQKDPNATPTKIALGVKTGGSINPGSDQALDASWATKQRLMTTNPVTTNPWTTAELDALQINLKARA